MTDTADKRRSVLGNTILPLVIYPAPDNSINKADRRHAAALYRGINTVEAFFFRWIPEQNSSATYRCEQDNSLSSKEEQNSSLSSSVEGDASSTYRCEQDSSLDCLGQVDTDED